MRVEDLHITLDRRLPFPNSVGGIFPGPVSTDEWFSQLAGPQSLTVLSMLIRGITIILTDDWHSGRLTALSPSIMLRNSLLTEGKIRHFRPVNVRTHQNYVSALKHNCNVMKYCYSIGII